MSMHPSSPALSSDLTFHCVTYRGRPFEMEVQLAYDAADPYAVWIMFQPDGADVRWAVSRELMLDGLCGPAGEGDVRLWPSLDDNSQPLVVIEFRSPNGQLDARVPAEDLDDFLTRTLALVPAGTETDHLDIDRLTGWLLDESN